jgi:WhiB family transcriptional regulator, redox-sensing transcriptional regulator
MTTATGGAADWRSAGACLNADTDLFFPISMTGRGLDQIAEAKAICARCRVRAECLEFAQTHDFTYGIWGGTTPEDRQRVRRRERRAARARARAKSAVSV